MHQPVLVHPDIHKGAEIHHVADGAGQLHFGLQVLHLQYVAAQHRGRQRFTGVTARLLQLGDDIPDGRFTGGKLLRQHLVARLFRHGRQLPQLFGADIGKGTAAKGQQPFGDGIAFRVDGGGVQRVFAAGDAQEAGALLIGLFAELGDLEELRTSGEAAVFLPVGHDIFGDGGIDAGDMPQQRGGRGIEVHPNRVDAAFHHARQSGIQPGGGHIVLILPDADGLGVDLHQLRQRVLQAAGDGNGAAQIDVIFREFLTGQLGGGIDRGPRFADNGILHRQAAFRNQLRHDFFRFPAGGTVADGDDGDVMLFQEVGDPALGFGYFIKGLGGIDHGGIQHPAGGIHHGQLAAVAVAGVPAQHHMAGQGRLHQQVVQVFGKNLDGLLTGGFEQLPEGLVLHAGGDEPLPAIGARLRHGAAAGIIGGNGLAADDLQRLFLLQHDGGFEEALLFAAVQRQHPVRGDAPDRFLIVVVHFIGGVFLAVAGGGHHGRPPDVQPQRLADLPVIGDVLGDNVHSAGQGVLCGGHALFGIEVPLRHGKRLTGRILRPDGGCQRLQSLFPGDAAAGAAFGLIGAVQVLHLGQRFGGKDGLLQLRGQLFLLGDGANDLLPALLQAAQVFQPVAQIAQGGVIQAIGHFLAVAGDKGDGIALVQQADGGFHLRLPQVELPGKLLYQIHGISLLWG